MSSSSEDINNDSININALSTETFTNETGEPELVEKDDSLTFPKEILKDSSNELIELTASEMQIYGDEITDEGYFEIYVYYEDDDDFTIKTLLPKLGAENIRYCCSEYHGVPGKTTFENFKSLVQISRKVLIVISKTFTENTINAFLLEVLFDFHIKDNIITLITDGTITKDIYFIRQTNIIYLDDSEWWRRLKMEITFLNPEFCAILYTGKVSNTLFLRGLCFDNFEYDVYGLLVRTEKKVIKLDMQLYLKHLNYHEQYNVEEMCGQCKSLQSPDTIVSLVFGPQFCFESDMLTSAIRRNIVKLCEDIMDAHSFKVNWLCGTSIRGKYIPNLRFFTAHLHNEIQHAIYNEVARRIEEPCFPQYQIIEERIKSFEEVWDEEKYPPIDKMAEAGFYFESKPNRAQCFFCGLSTSTWNSATNPLAIHSRAIRTCTYLLTKCSPDSFPVESIVIPPPIEDRLMNFDERKASFSNFKYSAWAVIEEDREIIVDCLSEAGFKYSGFDTCISCFKCKASVTYENPRLKPWILHAVISPSCSFVLSVKGKEFIETVASTMDFSIDPEPTVVTFLLKVFDGKHRIDWKEPITITMPLSDTSEFKL
ncbi:uncharacterized protein LOC134722990 [Mytilus trossulus]|uniref:uncharacterized protein LOC134722990 n=1 Tax=Mytilus trossulus TaxID=6551 RepID=UPI0030044E6E